LIDFHLCVYDRVCKVPSVLFNICVCKRKLISKLLRSAPAVLNGRCRSHLDMSRSSLGVVLRGLPARGRLVTFPVWRKRCYLLTCETGYW
jgi:hypothetical protein